MVENIQAQGQACISKMQNITSQLHDSEKPVRMSILKD